MIDTHVPSPPTPPAAAHFKMRFIRCSKVASFVALLLLCMARPGLPLSAKNANSSAAVKFVLIVSASRMSTDSRQGRGRGRQRQERGGSRFNVQQNNVQLY